MVITIAPSPARWAVAAALGYLALLPIAGRAAIEFDAALTQPLSAASADHASEPAERLAVITGDGLGITDPPRPARLRTLPTLDPSRRARWSQAR
ncbi:hypothetical protein GCM10023196_058420 [Actinoallomurus vinaceus]|uniref:Uncharacterized protein n=1 Tax=Actinoallomurus vinaceus TaxID=1080074 RepID=A0ABP8UI57_9ACTN